MTDKNIEKRIIELKELKALEKELTAEIKALEDEPPCFITEIYQ